MGDSAEGNFSFYAHQLQLPSTNGPGKRLTNKIHPKNDWLLTKSPANGNPVIVHRGLKTSHSNGYTAGPHPPNEPKPAVLRVSKASMPDSPRMYGKLPPISRSVSTGSLTSLNSNKSTNSSSSSKTANLPPIRPNKRNLIASPDVHSNSEYQSGSTEKLISAYQEKLYRLDDTNHVDSQSSRLSSQIDVSPVGHPTEDHSASLSSNDDDDGDFTVSSMEDFSQNDQTMRNELIKASGPFQPLYSLPRRDKHPKNGLLINEKSLQNASLASYEFLPLDFNQTDNKKLHRTLSNPEINSDKRLAILRAKLLYNRTNTPIHDNNSTTIDSSAELRTSGIYETISHLDKESPKQKLTFKALATMTSNMVPRISTAGARSRAMDNAIGDLEIYLPDGKLRVFCATWNMKGTKELPDCLDDLILPAESEYMQDVYVIATQEGTPLRKEWELKLQESLGPSHVMMHSASFGVLYLSIFIRRELVWFCTGIEQDTIATRMGHQIKTKGAIAVSFKIFGTSFLIINSHFTSNEGKIKDRINDYQTICKSLQLPTIMSDDRITEQDVTARYDRVFWMGDFNFRVVKPRKDVDNLLAEKVSKEIKISLLMEKDQLNQLLKIREIFHGFKENKITFLPTYKFDVNSKRYDTSSKQRVPSWTDRILYKTKDANAITMQCYNCCDTLYVSDHRPVYGIFEVGIAPSTSNYVPLGAQFDRQVYIEANIRRAAPKGNQSSSAVCTIL